MTLLTLGEAEREVDVTKSTISRAIKDGRLSATRNEHGHFQIDPAELFRVYEPTARNDTKEQAATPEHTTSQQPVQHHATPVSNVDEHHLMPWLIKRLEETESKLADTENELEAKESALSELRQAYAVLPSPEEFDEKLSAEVNRLKSEQEDRLTKQKEAHAAILAKQQHEQNKVIAMQRQENEQWKEALAERQKEIKQAKVASEALNQKAEQERQARDQLSLRLEALESRGLIARLLNLKPKTVTQ
jgi:hypothetical protein